MRYPVVLFDVGETLVGPQESFGSVYAAVLAALGLSLPRDVLDRSIRQTIEEMNRRVPVGTDRYNHFTGGEREYWLRFATRVVELASGTAPDPDFVLQALERLRIAFSEASAWRVYDDVLPALSRLKHDGVRLGVVSNWDSNLPRVLDLLGLSDYFETLGVSHIEGLEKPAPRFFQRVLERMGVEPRQALHIGDSLFHDVQGARAAGVDAILIDRARAEGTPIRHGTVRSLTEIPPIARDGIAPAGRNQT